jgi:hypothetical protein
MSADKMIYPLICYSYSLPEPWRNTMSDWGARDLHGFEPGRSVQDRQFLLATSSDERVTWSVRIEHGFLCVGLKG